MRAAPLVVLPRADPLRLYLSQMASTPSTAVVDPLRTFINGLRSYALFQKLDLLYLQNLHTDQASRINLIRPGRFTLTDVGTAPTWATGVGGAGGFTCNGAAMTTGWTSYVNGPAAIQLEGATFLIDSGTNTLSTNFDFGATNNLSGRLHSTAGVTNARVHDGTTETLASPANGSGLFAFVRAGGDKLLYRDGSLAGTVTRAATSMSTSELHIGGANGSTVGARRLRLSGLGGLFTATDVSNFTTLWTAFKTAISAT